MTEPQTALSEYMTRIENVARKRMDAGTPSAASKVKDNLPSARVLLSLKKLSRALPNQDFDWKMARDEGRR